MRGGVNYCWVDTCCIDKSNSTELSEAINSMFMWYEKAKVCYVYLADVGKHDSYDKRGEISRSRWFTRGWTLQELLAPRRVEFYDANWEALGTRSSLADIISDLTGIDVEVLDHDLYNFNPNEKSIAARMSWASNRQTTRVEDMAYCLLGIFGVNMPLLYGEGEKAFVRLQEEILKISLDLSILAWDFRNKDIGTDFSEDFERENTSILAPHPRYFANSDKVERIPRNIYGPFSMTNLGLEITLPIFKFSEDLYYAILGCRMKDREQYFIAMLLEKVEEAETFSRVRAKRDGFVTSLLAFDQAVAAIPQNLTVLRDLDYVKKMARQRDILAMFGGGIGSLPYILVRLIGDAKELFVDDGPAFLWPENARWEKAGGDYFGKAHLCPDSHNSTQTDQAIFFFRIKRDNRNYGEIKALRFVAYRSRAAVHGGCSQIPAHIDDDPSSESWQEWADSEKGESYDLSDGSCSIVPMRFTDSGFSHALVLTAE
jgi:hypothetical protein